MTPLDERLSKVQSLGKQIADLRRSFRKQPCYQKALQLQKLTRAREAIIKELRTEFEVVIRND